MACCDTSENSKFKVIRLAFKIVEYNYWNQKDAIRQVHNRKKYRAEILNQDIPELVVPPYPTIEEILDVATALNSFADTESKIESLEFTFEILSNSSSEFRSVSNENWDELADSTSNTDPLPAYPVLLQLTAETVIERAKKIVAFL